MNLIHLWIGLVGLVVILYVVLDGFSLGVGMLFPTGSDETDRDLMMDSIAPVWDANQTWIVFGGGALFAAFPMIYTVLFSALYIPLLSFVFGLIFRGVAFEFRANSGRKTFWNRAFSWGCLVATFAQGLTLGAYLDGIQVTDGHFSGGALDWLAPFPVMVGCGLIAGYILLGSTYLLIKTTGTVQEKAFVYARRAGWTVAGFMGLVSIWTPIHQPYLAARWMSAPRIYFVWIFPLLAIGGFYLLFSSLRKKREMYPFIASVLVFLSAYLGLQTAIFPNAILPDVTIFQAASQPKTQLFTLWGVILVIPVVLAYTVYSYWVFRGKVEPGEAYIGDQLPID
jgi:cytochrome bd ubiquinol oxidase subunit II